MRSRLRLRPRRPLEATPRVADGGVVEREAEYESILVAFEPEDFETEILATARKLAARRRAKIHVLVLVTVPVRASLDARMPEQELAARALIERARVQGGRGISGEVRRVRAGQAGRVIVEEARRLHAAAVVMPLRRRSGGASFFPKTVATVLAERPCRVILETDGGSAGAHEPVAPAG